MSPGSNIVAVQFAKDVIKQTPYPLLARAYYLYTKTSYQRTQKACIKTSGLPNPAHINPAIIKSNSDLFILGSGSSINDISDARWRQIKDGDSFGFNFWICHDHVPDLYTFELPRPDTYGGMGRKVIDKLVFWARKKQGNYRDTIKLVTDLGPGRMEMLDKLPPAFKSNLFAAPTVPAFARNKKELRYYISFLKRRGVFAQDDEIRSLFKYRATLSMLIALGVKLGYRRICLCGIDLNHSDYFYQDRSTYPEMRNFRSSLNTDTHATLVKKPMLMPIDEIVYALNEQVVAPQGATLFVEHKNSALFPRLPLFPSPESTTPQTGISPKSRANSIPTSPH